MLIIIFKNFLGFEVSCPRNGNKKEDKLSFHAIMGRFDKFDAENESFKNFYTKFWWFEQFFHRNLHFCY